MMYNVVIAHLIKNKELRRVTVFLSKKETIKVTRTSKFDARNRAETFVFTIGKPNFRDRNRIKTNFRKNYIYEDYWPKKKK